MTTQQSQSIQSGSIAPGRASAATPDVARVSIRALTPQRFHKEFRLRGVPVVIEDALGGIVPLDLAKLVSLVGDREFPTRCYGTERFNQPKTEWKNYCDIQMRTVAGYADMLEERSAHRDDVYMAQVEIGRTPLREKIGPVIDAIAAATGLRQQPPQDINLWLGPGGHTEPLHFDSHDGTLIQLRGTKRVSLFPPHATQGLYPFETFGGGLAPWISKVYIDRPDFSVFPLLANALGKRLDISLAEGEILFIPSGWWHEVTALSDDYVCSVNRFWKVRPLSRLSTAPRAAVLYGVNKFPLSWSLAVHRRIQTLVDAFSGRARAAAPQAEGR
jgi:lysine-specific demethylase 8/hypoxia-inducible factor 1-alpha inhibitor (HIF hydroxylase)